MSGAVIVLCGGGAREGGREGDGEDDQQRQEDARAAQIRNVVCLRCGGGAPGGRTRRRGKGKAAG